MSVKILSCQNSSCASMGATQLIRDLEELASGRCEVEEWGCLGKCGKGPNVELQWKGGKTKVVEGISSFKKALTLLQDKADVAVASNVQKLGKLKYELRRETDASNKQKLYKQCFDLIGGEAAAAKASPQQLSELLVMRSKDAIKTQIAAALKDAQKATELAPGWAQAFLALGSALEAAQRYAEGVTALKTALEIGKGINVGQVKRLITRTERKAKEQGDTPPPPLPPPLEEPEQNEATQSDAPAEPKAKAKAVAKAEPATNADASNEKATGSKKPVAKKPSAKKSGDKDTKKQSSDKDGKKASADKDGKKTADSKKMKEVKDPSATSKKVEEVDLEPIQRSPLDFVDWCVEETKKLNHNCIYLKLKSTDTAVTSRDPDPGDIWHVDFLIETDAGDDLKRAYTPISDAAAYKKGVLEFMIKVYPDGQMTPKLRLLGVGENLLVSPPAHTMKFGEIKDLVMIAGGSAITVAIQVCGCVLKTQTDAQVDLLMCNRALEDVLYSDILDDLQTRYASFRVVHCLSAGLPDRLPEKSAHMSCLKAVWHNGRANKDIVRSLKPGAKCVVSGPMGLCQAAVQIWAALGQSKETLEVLDELPLVEEQPDSGDEAKSEVVVTFQPGPIGIEYVADKVTKVYPDRQADQAGVEVGWRIKAVNGEKCESFADALFQDAKSGNKPYRVTCGKPCFQEVFEAPIVQEMVTQDPERRPEPEEALVVPASNHIPQKAPETNFGIVFCSFWKPLWCQGKPAETDDAEVPEIKLAS